MVALPLLDAVLMDDASSERSQRVSAELIDAALGEIRHIRNLDESFALTELDRATATMIRRMYEEWSDQVNALLDRIERIETGGKHLPKADELRDAFGRTRAMLAVPADRIERDNHAAQQPGKTIGEVRRELGLGTR